MVAKILVIDDQPGVGGAIARVLRGYDVSVETDPRSAVRRVADGERFDLVLCDLEMPEMNGREVYDAFRRENFNPLILMMSGHANVSSLFAAGCPVLLKPFNNAELRELVSACLVGRHRADASASLA
jgi:CheY-like chemotaxis protein